MLCAAVEKYITTARGLPFFYVVGDDNYHTILGELKQRGFIIDRLSDFCPKADRLPNLDEVIDHFRTLDVDYQKNRRVLIGLGEYFALRGSSFTEKELRRLKSTTLGNAKVVLLLRCVAPFVNAMVQEDNRILAQQRIYIDTYSPCVLSVTTAKYPTPTCTIEGLQGFLHLCEDGFTGNCCINTNLAFQNSIIPVTPLTSAYSTLKHYVSHFHLAEDLGSAEQWEQFSKELAKHHFSLDEIFTRHGFSNELDGEFHANCFGFEYRNWLYFLFLKWNQDSLSNNYLRYVLKKTQNYEELHRGILTEIIRIPRTDSHYWELYADRKRLIKEFPEADIAIFIHENDIDQTESIYRFTDNTNIERECVIRWISRYGYVQEIETIYPDLAHYMGDYVFSCGKLSSELTTYFSEYKNQKILNCVQSSFLERVVDNAHKLLYTHLENRDSALLRVPDKSSAFLYWIDALGVEYLAYIMYLAKKRGLTAQVAITYAELPTITSVNRMFFDQWPGTKKFKESELDEIKHKEKGGFIYKDGEGSIHLASELRVIEKAIDRAATELAMHTCKTFVIASDHGASRLAVLHKQEEKYPTDTIGLHSGRCCKSFEDADLPNAIEENGYLILADYGRFKGSRAANVEVHGGATLEEVVVPVITLALRKQNDLVIRLMNANGIYADRHSGTTLTVYISDVDSPQDVSIVVGTSRYEATCVDDTRYSFILPDMRRAKKDLVASVYDGDDLIGSFTFDILSKTAIVKDDFDDLF